MTRTVTALHPDDPRHGSHTAYINNGCRCQPCAEAGRENRRWRRTDGHSRPQYMHGGQAGMLRYLVGRGLIP